jgi:hypothetical protein
MGKYKSFFSLILLSLIIAFLSMVIVNASEVNAQLDGSADDASAIYRGVSTAVQFDVSPPLRSMQAAEVDPAAITEIPDRDTGLEGPLGPQDQDPLVQTSIGAGGIPAPLVSFNGPPNVAGVSPPDPVGDVGPNHYVAMSNLYFAVYDKTGTVLLGPSPNNT